ncbi:hypothetical protein KPH14_002965 [Odynerus spinipes]|uniref:Uncharacterized protein n=1 Tax=Odynerus spinipes TaxID=1348599 RepID=A0AAD9RXX0_9HYME|nr:hypothetical protein KPH14_002965 [Odynerus spinipes]
MLARDNEVLGEILGERTRELLDERKIIYKDGTHGDDTKGISKALPSRERPTTTRLPLVLHEDLTPSKDPTGHTAP